MTLSELVGEIDSNRQQGNLSSAIRLFVLDYFRSRANGGAGAASKGELAVMVGADDDAYDKVKPVFKQWASLVVRA
ncbi:hypothetical protein LTR94_037944, partial [Friedmanniomyces endolithicus]